MWTIHNTLLMSIFFVFQTLAFCFPWCEVSAVAVARTRAEEAAALPAVKRAWEERAAKYHSIRIEWDEDCYDSGPVIDPNGLISPPAPTPRKAPPSDDEISHTLHAKVALSGEKMRYELTGERPGAMGVTDQPYFATYDGETSKSLFDKGTEDTHPTGSITPLKQCEAVTQLDTMPVRMAYATLLPKTSEIKIDVMKARSQAGIIDGHRCIVLEQKIEGPIETTMSFWVNPAKEYAIERYQWQSGGKVQTQVDISYEFKPESGWLLSHWTSSRFGPDGSLITYSKTTVTQQEVNPRFEPNEFDIEFPVGTVVSDSRPIHKRKVGRTGTLDYVVLENGETRPIAWEDRRTSREDLMANSPSKASQTKNVAFQDGRDWMGLVAMAVVVAAAIVLLVMHWLRRGTTRGRA